MHVRRRNGPCQRFRIALLIDIPKLYFSIAKRTIFSLYEVLPGLTLLLQDVGNCNSIAAHPVISIRLVLTMLAWMPMSASDKDKSSPEKQQPVAASLLYRL